MVENIMPWQCFVVYVYYEYQGSALLQTPPNLELVTWREGTCWLLHSEKRETSWKYEQDKTSVSARMKNVAIGFGTDGAYTILQTQCYNSKKEKEVCCTAPSEPFISKECPCILFFRDLLVPVVKQMLYYQSILVSPMNQALLVNCAQKPSSSSLQTSTVWDIPYSTMSLYAGKCFLSPLGPRNRDKEPCSYTKTMAI